MPRLSRIYQKIFGSSAASGEIGKFGSLAAGSPTTTTDPAQMQSLSQWLGGWGSAVLGGNSPALEDMNAVHYVMAYQLAYLMQAGVPEWDSSTTYYIGSFAQDGNGYIYVSLTNNNTGNALTDTTNWKPFNRKITAVSTTYTVAATDDFVSADTTSGAFVVTLPTAASSLSKIYAVKNSSGTNNLTLQGNGAELIDSSNTQSLIPSASLAVYSNGTKWLILNSYVPAKTPTIQKYTSGSGTYTTPANVKYIKVKMVGGGGAGGGAGSAGVAGNDSTFALATAGGAASGGVGGTGSLGGYTGFAVSGGSSSGSVQAGGGAQLPGHAGGNSVYGGGGGGGRAGASNTGGGGGGNNGGGGFNGSGGGAGAYCEFIITSPAATYAYGVAGTGTGGANNGGSGMIIVEEYYQ
jgi:hypothetical protein